MNIIMNHKYGKKIIITLFIMMSVGFIYGCQCEGSIGKSSQNIEIKNTQFENK